MDPESLLAFARRYTEAWSSHDPSRVAAQFEPDAWIIINDGEPHRGRAGIEEVARGFYATVPDLHLILRRLIVEPGRTEYHWTFTGTNRGPGGTGQQLRIDGYEEWTMGDGLIASSHGHFDEAEYERQLEHGV